MMDLIISPSSTYLRATQVDHGVPSSAEHLVALEDGTAATAFVFRPAESR